MESGNPSVWKEELPAEDSAAPVTATRPAIEFGEVPGRGASWIFFGSAGLRAGWSVLIFLIVAGLAGALAGGIFSRLHLISQTPQFTAVASFFQELVLVLGMLGGAAVVALMERRSILDFNLRGLRRARFFLSGLLAGFLALSLLMAALWLGGWLRFGPVALSGAAILRCAALWGCVFLLVGCFEEGVFRCYLQFTLTRGLNFWWALGIIALLCATPAVTGKGNGIRGVLIVALLGLFPCYILHQRAAARSAFWPAAWVTSTLFGYLHTGNGGENWVGVFAAAAIGFVFCVSVWATGSAWWAIGCHAAWDWAETYFYGAADSGMVATGHFLTTTPAGKALWSGGSDGPEGSLLVLAAILLLLAFLIVAYGRRAMVAQALPADDTALTAQ